MTKFILFCVTLDLLDNLTEMRIVKNSNITMLYESLRKPIELFVIKFGKHIVFFKVPKIFVKKSF